MILPLSPINRVSSYFSCDSTAHRRYDCKFWQAICHATATKGHISTVCHSSDYTIRVVHSQFQLWRSWIHNVAVNSAVLDLIDGKDNLCRQSCQIGDTMLEFLVNFGSQMTIFLVSSAAPTRLPIEPAPSHVLQAYGGERIPVTGKTANVQINFSNFSHSSCVLVIRDGAKPILSMNFLPSLQFVKEYTPLMRDNSGFVASFCLQKDWNMDGTCCLAYSLTFSMKAHVKVIGSHFPCNKSNSCHTHYSSCKTKGNHKADSNIWLLQHDTELNNWQRFIYLIWRKCWKRSTESKFFIFRPQRRLPEGRFRFWKSTTNDNFHKCPIFCFYQDTIRNTCCAFNFPWGHWFCLSWYSACLCILRWHTHWSINKWHPRYHPSTCKQMDFRKQLQVKYLNMSNKSFMANCFHIQNIL